MASRRAKIAALLVSLAVGLLAIEGVLQVHYRLRGIDPRPPYVRGLNPRFVSHPFLPYSGTPHDQREIVITDKYSGPFKVRYHTNAYGFQGNEFVGAKPPDELRILTLGGSTTWRPGPDPTTKIGAEEDTWPNQLERLLAARFPDRRVVVYNLAQDAYSSPFSVVNLAFVGVDLAPDFVVTYDGINDMWQTFDGTMRNDYADRMRPFHLPAPLGGYLPPWLFHSHALSWLIKRIDAKCGYFDNADAAVFLGPKHADPFDGSRWNSTTLKNIELFLRNLRTMRGICREWNAVFVGATLHYFERDALRDQYNQALRRFFAEQQIPYFDADKAIPKHDPTVNTDDVHWTKHGCALMARGFADTLETLIRAKPKPEGGVR